MHRCAVVDEHDPPKAADRVEIVAGQVVGDRGIEIIRRARAEVADLGEESVVALEDAVEIDIRSEEHTSELQSLMRISYAVFCLKKKNKNKQLQRNKRQK